jgi:hypothetical protein
MKFSFLLFSFLTAGSASAAIRGLKQVEESSKRELKAGGISGMSMKGMKSSKGKGKACFDTTFEAGAIANKILADFWADAHALGCTPAGIEKALRAVISEDMLFTVDGGFGFQGADNAVAALVGDASIPGSLVDLCEEHYISWFASSVKDMDPDDNKFVFCCNESSAPFEPAGALPIGMLQFEISESLTPTVSTSCSSAALTFIFCIFRQRVLVGTQRQM